MTFPAWTEQSAYFPDPEHRVWLRRRLPNTVPLHGACLPFVLIGHNPSIAGLEGVDDPTMRRCVGFARACGCSDLIMVNAATGIATNADNLWKVKNPFQQALETIDIAARFAHDHHGFLVAAWGAPKGGRKYEKEVMLSQFNAIKRMGLPLQILRLTKSGYPEHPLYLPGDLLPQPWSYT